MIWHNEFNRSLFLYLQLMNLISKPIYAIVFFPTTCNAFIIQIRPIRQKCPRGKLVKNVNLKFQPIPSIWGEIK